MSRCSALKAQLAAWTILVPLGALLLACGPTVRQAGHTRSTAPPQSSELVPTPASLAEDPAQRALPPEEPPPSPPSAPVPLAPASRDGLISFGTNSAIAVEAASATGQWLAYCQPQTTTGDVSAPMPVDERGEPAEPIELFLGTAGGRYLVDRLLAIDETGRFVVVRQGSSTLLWDTGSGARHELDRFEPDLDDDGLVDHRSFAFSHSGRSLVLLTRTQGATNGALLFDLSEPEPTAHPKSVSLGPGRVWRVTAEGETFVFALLAEGRTPTFPARRGKSSPLRCARSSFAGFSRLSGPLADPSLSYRLLPTTNTTQLAAVEAPGFVLSLRDSWVRRTEDGRLLLVRGSSQKQIASSRCGARILHADGSSGLFLAACERYRPVPPSERERAEQKASQKKPEYRFELYLLRPGFVRSLKQDIMRTGVDLKASWTPQLVPLRPGAEQALVDFPARKLTVLEPGESVLLTNARAALLRQGERLLWFSGGKRQPVPSAKISNLSPVLTRGSVAAIGSRLVRLTREGYDTWTVTDAPLALTETGSCFVPRSRRTAQGWAMGPLTQEFADGPSGEGRPSP